MLSLRFSSSPSSSFHILIAAVRQTNRNVIEKRSCDSGKKRSEARQARASSSRKVHVSRSPLLSILHFCIGRSNSIKYNSSGIYKKQNNRDSQSVENVFKNVPYRFLHIKMTEDLKEPGRSKLFFFFSSPST